VGLACRQIYPTFLFAVNDGSYAADAGKVNTKVNDTMCILAASVSVKE